MILEENLRKYNSIFFSCRDWIKASVLQYVDSTTSASVEDFWDWYEEPILLTISLSRKHLTEKIVVPGLFFDMFLRFYWIYWSADDFKVLTFSINNSNSRTISDFKVRLSPSKKIYFYLLQWKPFKDDEKWFLLHLKRSFRSQYI